MQLHHSTRLSSAKGMGHMEACSATRDPGCKHRSRSIVEGCLRTVRACLLHMPLLLQTHMTAWKMVCLQWRRKVVGKNTLISPPEGERDIQTHLSFSPPAKRGGSESPEIKYARVRSLLQAMAWHPNASRVQGFKMGDAKRPCGRQRARIACQCFRTLHCQRINIFFQLHASEIVKRKLAIFSQVENVTEGVQRRVWMPAAACRLTKHVEISCLAPACLPGMPQRHRFTTVRSDSEVGLGNPAPPAHFPCMAMVMQIYIVAVC